MAVNYPDNLLGFNNTEGERSVFGAINSLGHCCSVLYSLAWQNPRYWEWRSHTHSLASLPRQVWRGWRDEALVRVATRGFTNVPDWRDGAGMRRSKRHSKRLKTFSTTTESLFREQGISYGAHPYTAISKLRNKFRNNRA